jgi:hypothetical protein
MCPNPGPTGGSLKSYSMFVRVQSLLNVQQPLMHNGTGRQFDSQWLVKLVLVGRPAGAPKMERKLCFRSVLGGPGGPPNLSQLLVWVLIVVCSCVQLWCAVVCNCV